MDHTGFAVYDELSGRIIRCGQCLVPDLGLQPDYGNAQNVVTFDPGLVGTITVTTYYVDLTSGAVLTPRPSILSVATDWTSIVITNTGIDKAKLGNGDLPFETLITIQAPIRTDMDQPPNPDPILVDDGDFTFRSTFPGRYVITASCFPYADYTQTIEVQSLDG